MFDKLKQLLCRHKNAIPIGEYTHMINGGMRKVRVGKYYCVHCCKEFEKELEVW